MFNITFRLGGGSQIDLLTCRALSDRIILTLNFFMHILVRLFILYNLLDILHAVHSVFVKEILEEINNKCRATL